VPSTVYQGNAYINVPVPPENWVSGPYFDITGSIDNNLFVFIHEYGHLLGANDKYRFVDNVRSVASYCNEDGLGDLDKNPLFPQRASDLYCGNMYSTKEDFENRRSVSAQFSHIRENNQFVINRYTAKELGWQH